MRFFKFVCCLLLGAVASSVLIGSGITQGVTFQQGGTAFGAGTILNIIQGTGMTITHTFTGGVASYTFNSSGGGGGFYQTVQQAGTPLPQEPVLNFPSNVSCVDNPGNTSTDCTPSGGGGVITSGWTLTQPSGALATLSDFQSTGIALNQESTPALGGIHFAVATQPIPGATYTVIATTQCQGTVGSTGAQVLVCGLALFDGTKFEDIEFLNEFTVNNMQLAVRQSSALTAGGSLVAGPTNTLIGQYPTFKVQDNGTNRIWSYWSSGAFHVFFTEASGAFLTPTAVGAITLNDSGNNPVFNTVLVVGWTATSP